MLQDHYVDATSTQSAWDLSQELYDGNGYGNGHNEEEKQSLPVYQHDRVGRNGHQFPQCSGHQQPMRSPHVASFNHQHSSSASHHGTGRWTSEGYASIPHDPSTNTLQSQGLPGREIYAASPHQYAAPQIPPQAACSPVIRRQPLGPPPSARRGPAKYYPPADPVHPIIEETDSMLGSIRSPSVRTTGHESKTSIASSNAIPIGISPFHLDNHGGRRPSTKEQMSARENPEDDDVSVERAGVRGLEKHVDITPSNGQQGPDALVRQASIGKKGKPTLTVMKSGERSRTASGDGVAILPSRQHVGEIPGISEPRVARTKQPEVESPWEALQERLRRSTELAATLQDRNSGEVYNSAMSAPSHVESLLPKGVFQVGTGLLEDSSSSESESGLKKEPVKEVYGPAKIRGRLSPRLQLSPPSSPADVFDSLEKGSVIKTGDHHDLKKPIGGLSERVGRRRPPRINVDAVRDAEARASLTSLPDLIKRATKLAANLDRGSAASRLWRDRSNADDRSGGSGSISEMLSAFPPPHRTQPPSRDRVRRSPVKWPSHLKHYTTSGDRDAEKLPKQRRRCCGMPLWVFVGLIVFLILTTATAVVVPVALLVVVPNENRHGASAVASCQEELSCENGGTNILSANRSCQCLCVNGYIGLTCSTQQDQGCTVTSIGATSNATVGDAIPRLLADSTRNFSIPLDGQDLLALFSTSNLSCTSQNALVTFNGMSHKRSATASPSLEPALEGRQAATPSASTTPTALANNRTTLDFARIAVLYVFQTSGGLDNAVTAQENLQVYFGSSQTSSGIAVDTSHIPLGNGDTCDLTAYTIEMGNGTTVGGSSGQNITASI